MRGGGGRVTGGVFMVLAGVAAGVSLALPYLGRVPLNLFSTKVSIFDSTEWFAMVPLGAVVATLAFLLTLTGALAAAGRRSRAPGIIGLVGTIALGGFASYSFLDIASLSNVPDPTAGAFVAGGAILLGLIGSIVAVSSPPARPSTTW